MARQHHLRAAISGLLIILTAAAMGCGSANTVQASDPSGTASNTLTDQSVGEASLEEIPIKEVTIFKDGHAFVLHEGVLPVADEGRVHLKELPSPVMGTFWPYARGENVQLTSVLAARRTVSSKHTALNIQELVRANVGAKVQVKQSDEHFTGTIVSVPSRTRDPDSNQDTAGVRQPGSVVMLETAEGFRVIALDSIQEITFLDRPNPDIETERLQHVLTLQLESKNDSKLKNAKVGMAYVQRGIRWIPNYRLELDGNGRARVRLQATLINEMIDLENVTANLVIGVPHFAFKETVDPIALGRTTAQLSRYFQEGSQTAFAMSNAIQTQVARMGEYRNRVRQPAEATMDLGPELSEGGKREDLFVFPINGVSLKKGQRMVVPVVEFDLPYQDVFTVKLDMSPPPELIRHFNNSQQQQLAQLLHAPKAAHKARLTNKSKFPLTTAPALILKNGQPLGQAMMTYTPVGARVDVEITAAVDISVVKSDEETGRKPNAANWGGVNYDRVDLAGEIHLQNYGDKPVKLEVVRQVLGNIDEVGADGKSQRMNVREEGWRITGGYPHWWHWYSWPSGWFHLNGIGRLTWTVELESGKSATLPYKWHYFWRR